VNPISKLSPAGTSELSPGRGRLNFRPVQIRIEKRLGSATTLYGTVALSFVIPRS
jgi:hypothetical protein